MCKGKVSEINKKNIIKKHAIFCAGLIAAMSLTTACGESADSSEDSDQSAEESYDAAADTDIAEADTSESTEFSIENESAEDGEIDWESLIAVNPDIFAWLYVPGTDIDTPVACSMEAPDYYASHDYEGNASDQGAAYIEYYNVTDMSDFDTCIYGYTDQKGSEGLFKDLYDFADPDFFDANQTFYVYTESGYLQYEIIAAYERDNTDIFDLYDTTSEAGCQTFIEKEYDQKKMGANYREGFETLSPYYYMVSLTTGLGHDSDKQFVVLGLLVKEDPEGQVSRTFMSDDYTDIDAK